MYAHINTNMFTYRPRRAKWRNSATTSSRNKTHSNKPRSPRKSNKKMLLATICRRPNWPICSCRRRGNRPKSMRTRKWRMRCTSRNMADRCRRYSNMLMRPNLIVAVPEVCGSAYCRVLQSVAECCRVLQCVAVNCDIGDCRRCYSNNLPMPNLIVAVFVVRLRTALCCSGVWGVAVSCSVSPVRPQSAVCCSGVRCIAGCCSVSQCVAVSSWLRQISL